MLWPEETNRRFLEYVRGGGGVVVYHAADNAFVNWPEYNKICALGGWENRDEKAGPYVYWSDGKLIRIARRAWVALMASSMSMC